MLEINYLCFLRRTDDFRLLEIRNLNISGIHYDFDFIKPISEFSFDYRKQTSTDEKERENGNEETRISEQMNDDRLEQEAHENLDKLHGNNNTPKNTSVKTELIKDNHVELEKLDKTLDEINDVLLNNGSEEIEKTKSPPIENIEDVDTLLQAVPEVIKYTNEELKDKEFYYYFVLSDNILVVAVNNEYDDEVRPHLVKFLRRFQKQYNEEEIHSATQTLFTPRLMLEFSLTFYEKMLSDHIIPYICSKFCSKYTSEEEIKNRIETITLKIYEKLKEIDESIQRDKLLSILDKLDGLSCISAISESVDVPINILKIVLLYLDLNSVVDFRRPFYLWTVFERTHKANSYLYDGSDEQMTLIDEFGGGKIVSLLSRFDGRSSLKKISKRMELKKLKIIKYIHGLMRLNLINPKGIYPKLDNINEEIVSILAMQGVEQEDIDLINEIAPNFNGSNELTQIALENNQSPDKIKSLLSKIPQYVKMNID